MNCSCRTSSLRIFLQSLTQLPLSGTASRPARHLDPRSVGGYQHHGSVRSFTAASVARYPRHTLRTPIHNGTLQRAQDVHSGDVSNDAPGQSNTNPITSSLAADASARDLDKAKSDGTILDFSLEAIDALAADLRRTPIEDTTSARDYTGSEVDSGSPTRPRPSQTGESNRLKRSKIMPNIKRFEVRSEQLPPRKKESWQIQKAALQEKFPEGWQPRKRLSPDALEGIRALHTQYPEEYTTPVLAEKFQVSAEAIRRILRAKWTPTADQEISRQERWFNRGKNIWSQMAELGTKPPKKWREEGVVRDPRFNKKRGHRTEYPYQPRRQPEEDYESTQRKLGGSLL